MPNHKARKGAERFKHLPKEECGLVGCASPLCDPFGMVGGGLKCEVVWDAVA